MIKRIEKPIRNHEGIYKEFKVVDGLEVETGRYRATRRVKGADGRSKKEALMCDSLEEAKAFRRGDFMEKPPAPLQKRMSFRELVLEWQPFHYLKLEKSTQQTYDKRLPNLEYLFQMPVEEITVQVIDKLIQFWVHELPKKRERENFEKELNLLKVILNYYRKRKNPAYIVPVFLEHYQASDIAKKAESPVQALTKEELSLFLESLKSSPQKEYYPVALAQFCLGLRVGEVCGLYWDGIDLEKRVARIEWTIVWDHLTWLPTIKKRPKNGKTRFLVIPEVLAEELGRLISLRDPNVPLVFHREGKPLNRQLIGKAYNSILKRMGIQHIRGTHMLRKTAATLANEITGDFYAVSKLLDHQNPNVTLRYVSQTGVQKQKVAEALNSVLARPSNETQSPQQATENEAPGPKKLDQTDRPRLFLIKSMV